MTGTAETEADEFAKIYNLDVDSVPTHHPMVRTDNPDMIYRTLPEKWDAVVEEIKELHEKGQPVLVGTVSVENSELISDQLRKIGIKHNVLNAKPEITGREAEIVAQAGRKGAVTIATNMAGRGTDILLGGNPDFLAREFLKKQEINPDEATPEQIEEAIEKVRAADRSRAQRGRRPGRIAHPRHRATRIAPHRQPASRTRRTSGRPRLVAFLSVARRRSDAHLRRRQGQGDDATARDGKRRRHRIEDGHQTNRGRAEERRSRRTSRSANTCSNTTTS